VQWHSYCPRACRGASMFAPYSGLGKRLNVFDRPPWHVARPFSLTCVPRVFPNQEPRPSKRHVNRVSGKVRVDRSCHQKCGTDKDTANLPYTSPSPLSLEQHMFLLFRRVQRRRMERCHLGSSLFRGRCCLLECRCRLLQHVLALGRLSWYEPWSSR
jgi:hypothetical protein